MPGFIETLNPTPFGFWDSDTVFQWDADRMVTFVMRRLGEDILGVELTKKMVWASMEEATSELSSLLIEYQANSNLSSLLGMPTGSFNPTTSLPTINLSNVYIQNNLQFLDNLAAPYAAMIGYGFAAESYSGSITLSNGIQDYDLYTDLKEDSGVTLYSLQPSGSVSKLQVYDVYHNAPIQYVFNSNLASNFIASGLPVESYVPDTRFYVLPLFEDVLRSSMLGSAQKIRKSHYSYRISGRKIRIFPVPQNLVAGVNDRLWIRVGFKQQPLPTLASTLVASGTLGGPTGAGTGQNWLDQSVFGVNGPFTAPFGPVAYSSLNAWARNWIAHLTLAVCTELLGRVRSKISTIPIPGAELTINGEALITQAREDKEKLFSSLKETLESLTYDKLAEREASKAEQMVKMLAIVPMNPKYIISVG